MSSPGNTLARSANISSTGTTLNREMNALSSPRTALNNPATALISPSLSRPSALDLISRTRQMIQQSSSSAVPQLETSSRSAFTPNHRERLSLTKRLKRKIESNNDKTKMVTFEMQVLKKFDQNSNNVDEPVPEYVLNEDMIFMKQVMVNLTTTMEESSIRRCIGNAIKLRLPRVLPYDFEFCQKSQIYDLHTNS